MKYTLPRTLLAISVFAVVLAVSEKCAHALPAFALREKVSCTLCHTNGSAPHLTKVGYIYRRAGFRFPTNIGNAEADSKSMTFQEHMAAGLNVDYEYVRNAPPGQGVSASTTSNQFNIPEVELWPVVGGFLGNYAFWSEIDATPGAAGQTASVNLSMADLRYIGGTPDFFYGFRGGLMALEGYGASDQWIDDGNIPLMDRLTPNYNQDTVSAPLGAMNNPEYGLEVNLSYMRTQSFLTLGMYNGYDGTGGTASLQSALMREKAGGLNKDFRAQIDQMIADYGSITATYYIGAIQITNPASGPNWTDHYNHERLYLTYFALPNTLDVFLGGALASNEYMTAATGSSNGSFSSTGGFFGLNYYAMPHMTVSGRVDTYRFSTRSESHQHANGYSVQVGLPFENNQYVVRFNRTSTDLASGDFSVGNTSDFRAEWRFLF